jgi:hypothetical protein
MPDHQEGAVPLLPKGSVRDFDAEALVSQVVASGQPPLSRLGQIHGFLTFDPAILPRSREALGVVANAIAGRKF